MPRASLRVIRDDHASLAAILRSLTRMVHRGPVNQPEQFFDVVRSMLFYVDEFPRRLHHSQESDCLFPKVVRVAPHVKATVDRLNQDHLRSEVAVRELQHHLLAWELLGESRREIFDAAAQSYADLYMEHIRLEESVVLPEAEKSLNEADWVELDVAFAGKRGPATSKHPPDAMYGRLFTRIVMMAPEPIGLGSTR